MSEPSSGSTPGSTSGSSDLSDKKARVALMSGVAEEPGAAKSDPILTVDNVVREFGGIRAVDVGHLEVQRGTITALIGPNGAGKTTLFNLITGFDRPTRGAGRSTARRSAGLAPPGSPPDMVRTFQLTKALDRMTVLDNMLLGAPGQRGERCYRRCCRPMWSRAGARDARRRRRCSTGSALAKRTTSQARCPAASASCSRWRGR